MWPIPSIRISLYLVSLFKYHEVEMVFILRNRNWRSMEVTNTNEPVSRILKEVMVNDYAKMYSYHGVKGKLKFKLLKLTNVLIYTICINCIFTRCSPHWKLTEPCLSYLIKQSDTICSIYRIRQTLYG